MDVPQLPTPPSSYSNIPSLANSMSLVTPPNYESDSTDIVSSAGSNTMQLSGDNISPPHHHVHARKSSSPIPAHMKTQTPIDMEAPFAQENFECPSTRCACQVEHGVCVRSPVRVVGLVGPYAISISFTSTSTTQPTSRYTNSQRIIPQHGGKSFGRLPSSQVRMRQDFALLWRIARYVPLPFTRSQMLTVSAANNSEQTDS